MKKVFLLIGVAGFYSASGQQNNLFDEQKHLQKKGKQDMPLLKLSPAFKPLSVSPSLSYTLQNGDKMLFLPVDNMPCIIPDMSQFKTMPNAVVTLLNFSLENVNNKPGDIPNAAPPQQPLVQRK